MNHYCVLKVGKKASQSDIKSQYRKLAKKHHPDSGGLQSDFISITSSYEILDDPQKRQEYDDSIRVSGKISSKRLDNLAWYSSFEFQLRLEWTGGSSPFSSLDVKWSDAEKYGWDVDTLTGETSFNYLTLPFKVDCKSVVPGSYDTFISVFLMAEGLDGEDVFDVIVLPIRFTIAPKKKPSVSFSNGEKQMHLGSQEEKSPQKKKVEFELHNTGDPVWEDISIRWVTQPQWASPIISKTIQGQFFPRSVWFNISTENCRYQKDKDTQTGTIGIYIHSELVDHITVALKITRKPVPQLVVSPSLVTFDSVNPFAPLSFDLRVDNIGDSANVPVRCTTNAKWLSIGVNQSDSVHQFPRLVKVHIDGLKFEGRDCNGVVEVYQEKTLLESVTVNVRFEKIPKIWAEPSNITLKGIKRKAMKVSLKLCKTGVEVPEITLEWKHRGYGDWPIFTDSVKILGNTWPYHIQLHLDFGLMLPEEKTYQNELIVKARSIVLARIPIEATFR